MPLMATLIANPVTSSLTPSLGIKASAAINATGLYWLADGIACDIALKDGTDAARVHAELDGRTRWRTRLILLCKIKIVDVKKS